jgi:glycosyltransferase involved in cell wall biosynthesis
MVEAARQGMSRIVIDARESGTSTGRYIDKLVEYLNKLKPQHEIIVLTKSPRFEYLKNLAPDFKIVRSNYSEFGFAEQAGLLKQLRKLNADLVHFGMTQQPVLYKGLVITTVHDLTTARFDNPAKNRLAFKTKQQIYKRVIKRVAKKSRYIITPSNYVKQDVAQYAKISPNKIFVTYEAADRTQMPAKPVPRLENKKFIMYVGRATPHKNLERLIDAFGILHKEQPDLMLALAGKFDTNYHQLEARVTGKRLAAAVVFTDFITEGQLRWMYEKTAAYVFPSLSEGFGLPGLEAMMHGAPVVSSNATCLPEIYGDAVHYFDPHKVSDIAAKVNEVLTNPRLRASLINNGRAQAAKYSWRRMAAQTLKIYEHTLNKNT